MAYRATPKTIARKAEMRQRVLDAASALVGVGGFGALSMQAVALGAGMATGAVYLHFKSKAELCAEVFRLATEREVSVVRQAAQPPGCASTRLARCISVFSERALRARRMAYALIAEPVDALVDAERLRYRLAYAQVFEQLVREGVTLGEFAPQDAVVSAAALVGVIAESLVGPLSTTTNTTEPATLVRAIESFCLRAVGVQLAVDLQSA